MNSKLAVLRGAAWVVVYGCVASIAIGAEPAMWSPQRAANYLDGRLQAWFEYPTAKLGQGPTQTACVCCHTCVPFAMTRPVLRKTLGETAATEAEQKLLAQTRRRIENWERLDTPAFGLQYDESPQKKAESWGTEAVLNAVIWAQHDRAQGATSVSETTRTAFANLWSRQAKTGDLKGSWEWLAFDLEPWESQSSRYFGASLAALAVGTAPGYYTPGGDAGLDERVSLLKDYLRSQRAGQHLHHRVWCLWGSSRLEGVFTTDERKQIVDELFAKQRPDGGWSLASLGSFTRSDGTAQATTADGYATGLVLQALQTAGLSKNDVRVAKGLAWLRANQKESGAWAGVSVNVTRDPATHIGKFMSDAATALAALALSH